MPVTKEQHLDRTRSPKRILALDGGGIRGILTLEYLGLIEDMLKSRSGRNDFRLSDYFDLIGGTSTGSIIAATPSSVITWSGRTRTFTGRSRKVAPIVEERAAIA